MSWIWLWKSKAPEQCPYCASLHLGEELLMHDLKLNPTLYVAGGEGDESDGDKSGIDEDIYQNLEIDTGDEEPVANGGEHHISNLSTFDSYVSLPPYPDTTSTLRSQEGISPCHQSAGDVSNGDTLINLLSSRRTGLAPKKHMGRAPKKLDPLRYVNRLYMPRRLRNTPTKSHQPPSPRMTGPKPAKCAACGRAFRARKTNGKKAKESQVLRRSSRRVTKVMYTKQNVCMDLFAWAIACKRMCGGTHFITSW